MRWKLLALILAILCAVPFVPPSVYTRRPALDPALCAAGVWKLEQINLRNGKHYDVFETARACLESPLCSLANLRAWVDKHPDEFSYIDWPWKELEACSHFF